MRIGMSRPSWMAEDNSLIFNLAEEYGFDGVQVKPHQYDPVDVNAVRFIEVYGQQAQLARAGIIVYLGSEYQTWEQKLPKFLSFVKGIGGQQICICAGVREEHLDEKGVQGFSNVLNAMGKQAKEVGAVISLHNHANSIVESITDIQRVFANIDPTYCGMTFDTAHAAKGGIKDLAGALEKFRPFINSIHLKDLSSEGKFCPLGEGTLDLSGVINTLEQWDYKEWLIVDEESEGISVHDAYKKSVDFLQTHGLLIQGSK